LGYLDRIRHCSPQLPIVPHNCNGFLEKKLEIFFFTIDQVGWRAKDSFDAGEPERAESFDLRNQFGRPFEPETDYTGGGSS
jgi:hypothetical protein